MIAAFEGWNDAGEAASTALEHLELMWDAEPLAAIDPEDYYDFQVTRPHVRLADGVTRRIEWQTTRLSWAVLPGTERHVVLVNGIEPNLRWRSFCRELLDHAERLGVTKVITLGALLTDTPHTRPTPVSGTSYDKASAASMDVEPSTYQGPTGIVGVFQNACVEAGIPAFSFWASVPHYVSQARVPKAAVALLHRVEEVLDVEVPLGALPEQAEEWERTVSEMAEADDEVREYVRQLEEQAEESGGRPGGRRRHDRRRLRALPAPPRRGRPGPLIPRRLAVAGLYAGAFIGPFGGGVTVAMLPELGASYGVSSGDVAVSVTAYLLPFAALQVVSGTLGRAVGRAADGPRRLRRVHGGVAALRAGADARGVPRRPGAAGRRRTRSRPRCCSRRSRAPSPPERLGRALGWFGSLQAAGQTSAPLIGGLAAEFDWRWAFAVSARGERAAGGRRHPGHRTSAPSGRPACARRGGATCCASAWSPPSAGGASPG